MSVILNKGNFVVEEWKRALVVQKMEGSVLSLIPLKHLWGRWGLATWELNQPQHLLCVWRLCCGDIIPLYLHSKPQGSFMCLIERQGELVWAHHGRKLGLPENKTNKPNETWKGKKGRNEERVLQWAQKLSSARMLNPISFLSHCISNEIGEACVERNEAIFSDRVQRRWLCLSKGTPNLLHRYFSLRNRVQLSPSLKPWSKWPVQLKHFL